MPNTKRVIAGARTQTGTMECDICGTKTNSGSFVWGEGFACSDDCAQIAQGRRQKFHDDLANEEISEMPEKLETHDFERWTLKFAIQWLRALKPEQRKQIADGNPMILVPENLALDFKDRIIRHLHKAYVSEMENRGHARLFSGGTYCFRQAVPREEIIIAAQKAELTK